MALLSRVFLWYNEKRGVENRSFLRHNMMNYGIKSAALAAFLLFGALLGGAISGCDQTVSTRQLDLDPDTKPYQLKEIHATKLDPQRRDLTLAMALGDIDGDGFLERIEGNTSKLLGYDREGEGTIHPRWEIHLPGDLYLDDELGTFGVCRDLDGDRVDELFFVAMTKSKTEWRFLALNLATQEFFLNIELPRGEDRRRPVGWDGVWATIGFLEATVPGGEPSLLLMHRSGYDATYRGFCAISPTTGEIRWDFVSGAQPCTPTVRIVDLDGDGVQEICWATTAPNNLGGRKINGISDDRAHVMVLSNQGQLLFRQEIAVLFSGGGLQTWDLNGDGVKELVVATENGSTGGNSQLSIFDWEKEIVVASQRRVPTFRGLALAPGPQEGSFWIYAGSNNGAITRHLFRDDTLVQDAQLLTPETTVSVLGQADFLPTAGQEIVVNIGAGGDVVLLDRDMEQLAVLPGEKYGDKTFMTMLPTPGDRPLLVLASHRGHWALDYERNPARYLAVLGRVLLWVLALAALFAAFRLGVSRGRRSSDAPADGAPPASPAKAKVQADRQILYSLYRELADINHQVVGRAKGLQRLVWLMDAYTTDMGDRQAMEQRIRQVALDFRESVHPVLVSILNQSGSVAFEMECVEATRQVLASLAERVDRLVGFGLDPEKVGAERVQLKEEWSRVEEGLLQLRETVNAYFTTDAVRMFQGLILIRSEEFERTGIAADFQGGAAGLQGTLARIDSSDLRFVLDNLLDNALRAIGERGEGNEGLLAVKVIREGREISLSISDNGVGIDPRLHEEIFSSRFSSHPGGGHGLHRTREILAKWGGEIRLVESRPGQGTTFIVKLLAAGDGGALHSQEARA